MKKLIYVAFALVMLMTFGCRRHKTIQYVRVVQDSAEAAANDIPGIEDVDGYIGDDEGIVSIPDAPQERPVNMRSSDDDLMKIMRGEE